MTEERTKELLESAIRLSYQRADEIERLEAERLEFSGYLEQIFVLFGRCNFSGIPARVRGLVEERDAARAEVASVNTEACRVLAELSIDLADLEKQYEALNADFTDANMVLPGDGRLSVRIARLRAEVLDEAKRAMDAWEIDHNDTRDQAEVWRDICARALAKP